MKRYYPTINLLRGLAAFLVCFYHFTNYSDTRGSLFPLHSWIPTFGHLCINGIYIFFVISGFVIPLSLAKENYKLPQLLRFLYRRFIRIEIPYIISILLILLVSYIFAVKNHQAFSIEPRRLAYHVFYLVSFSHYQWYNIIYWTLAIEFQFYIFIGVTFFLLSQKNKIILYMSLFAFGAPGFIIHDDRFIFHYLIIFLYGIILFLNKTERIGLKQALLCILLCLAGSVYLYSLETSIFCLLTVLIIYLAEINHKYTNRFGEISYSLYLTHGLSGGSILYLLSPYATGTFEKLTLVFIALAASLLFSYLFWKFIENPSRKISKKVRIARVAE